MKYFDEIVGLRLYLAMWVAIGHALQLSGVMQSENKLVAILLQGHAAVAVFMIVSGFVITNLIVGKQEPYLPYITRRFFRLFPAYALACIFGLIMTGPWLDLVKSMPWQASKGWGGYVETIQQLNDEVAFRFFPHLLAHLTMLHGIIPAEILNRASATFLPAAWSISLEWQFYLVAPLVILSLRRWWSATLVAIISMVALEMQRRGALGTFQMDSAIFGASGYFAVGIASRLLADRLGSLNINPIPVIAISIYVLVAFHVSLPLAIWFIFYPLMLWGREVPRINVIFQAATNTPLPKLLGEASFSIYLLHRPMQVLFASIAASILTPTPSVIFAAQMLGTLICLPISVFVYFRVERPGMQIGSWLAKRISSAPKPAGSKDVTSPE